LCELWARRLGEYWTSSAEKRGHCECSCDLLLRADFAAR
jgi:hypothetical protein